jgi:hypothetical protein
LGILSRRPCYARDLETADELEDDALIKATERHCL